MTAQDGKFTLRLFGPFGIRNPRGQKVDVGGKKNRGLIAILATAPDGLRSRAQLSQILWASSGTDEDRASLRKALSEMRRRMGDDFERLIYTDNHDVRLDMDAVELMGSGADGDFLEGLDIREPAFCAWREEFRRNNAVMAATEGPTVFNGSLRAAIAVLPFSNPVDEPSAGVIGDLVAEEVSRALSRSSMLDVVSHLSCRDHLLQRCSLSELKTVLGVDYVVSGRLRGGGNRLLLDVELVDVRSQRNRWTRQYPISLPTLLRDGCLAVEELVNEIGRTILLRSIEVTASNPLPTVDSHALLISAIALMHRQSLVSFSSARPQLEELVHRAPRQAIPHAWLSKWYVLSIQQGWSVDFKQDGAIAERWTQHALDLDPDCTFSLAIDGFVQNNLLKRFDLAQERFDHAIDADCNNALAWLLKGTLHAFQDKGLEAVAYTSRARSLSPLDPYRYFFDSLSATAHLANGDYVKALDLAERSLRANRRHTSTLRVKTIALHQLGRGEDARAAADQLRRLDPGLTVEGYMRHHPAAMFRTGKEWSKALKESGIPVS